jgi:hypothetical protein
MHVEIVDTCYTSLIVDTMSYVLFINNCNVSGLLDWVEFLSEVGGVNQNKTKDYRVGRYLPFTPDRGLSFHLTHLTSISYGQQKNFHSLPLILSNCSYPSSPTTTHHHHNKHYFFSSNTFQIFTLFQESKSIIIYIERSHFSIY